MRQLTEILILKLHIKHKFMIFNLVLCNDYPSVAIGMSLFCFFFTYFFLAILFILAYCARNFALSLVICDRIYEKGLIHTSNSSTLRMCNSAFIGPTALKFGSRTLLSLY